MKLNVTVSILRVEELHSSVIRSLSDEMQQAIQKMPVSERATKSVLYVDAFPPRLIDNKAIYHYFPMFVPRTFQEALVLIKDSANLRMVRGDVEIRWARINFLDKNGKVWSPTPSDILSTKAEWRVHSKSEEDFQKATPFSRLEAL